MKILALTSILLLLTGRFATSQVIPPDSLYFGQTPPGNIPQLFAPGIVSLPGRNEAVITFSPDGETVFFYIEKYPAPGNPYTLFSTYTNNHWTTPDTIAFSVGRSTGEPFFACNGDRLYMFASNAVNHQGIIDLSYSELLGTNWSNPVSLGSPPNSESYQYHPCVIGDTSIYFSSYTGQVCRSQYNNGAYETRVVLPRPVNYIGSQTWGDPFVSADESYMIIKSIREEGFGQNDLYIAYRKPDSSWTNPKNLGNRINTPNDETSGDITPDGLYMTYGSNKDLYWVSTSFIDSLKYTNYVPYVKNLIPNQKAFVGLEFTYTVPDSTFYDDDVNSTLSFNAKLTNGNPIPSWLSFDSITGAFIGNPPIVQTLMIKITAKDIAGASASTTLKLIIQLNDATDYINERGVQIYPNPTGGLLNIILDESTGKPAIAEIYNLEGKVFLTNTFKNKISIDLSAIPRGIYVIKLVTGNDIIINKICLN
jgi:hypothetical protein